MLADAAQPKAPQALVIADSKLPVPPSGYGGTERMMAHIADGLAAAGLEVTLMGHPQSRIDGRVVGYPWAGRRAKPRRAWARIAFNVLLERELRRRPDIVLANCRVDYLARLARRGPPLVYRFDNPIISGQAAAIRALGIAHRMVALSHAHAGPIADDPSTRVVGNCVEVERFAFSADGGEGYLAFLGRLTRNKGVDTAIRVARRAGLPLRIAGNVSDEEGGRAFFESEVAPHLGGDIQWIGEIGDAEKSDFLGNARGLLVPIRWEEPFGLIVPEALACGTPVIASPRASMPELVRPGVNGMLAADEDAFVAAVGRLSDIDRSACRADARARFSRQVVVNRYLEIIGSSCRGARTRALEPGSGRLRADALKAGRPAAEAGHAGQ